MLGIWRPAGTAPIDEAGVGLAVTGRVMPTSRGLLDALSATMTASERGARSLRPCRSVQS